MQNPNDSILVHICCSVDSHHFLTELRALYPNARLVGYFYNPNIHPYEEYQLRLLDVARSCAMLGVELIDESYDVATWLCATEGQEDAPEKGERCGICFGMRLRKSAQKAKELGITHITTTLLTSPLKPQAELFALGEAIAADSELCFVALDCRSNGGTQKQQNRAKQDRLYRQNYCGCFYALQSQRERAGRNAGEMFCPVAQSRYLEYPIHHRIATYARRIELEREKIPYHLYKKQQYFYYPFFTRLTDSKQNLLPCYTLTHSLSLSRQSLRKQKIQVCLLHNGIGYTDKQAMFITLATFNALCHTRYASIAQLLFAPPPLSREIAARRAIEGIDYGMSLILVVQDFALHQSFTLSHYALFQEETIESLLLLSAQDSHKDSGNF